MLPRIHGKSSFSLSPGAVFAVGWSNGGYLVDLAASIRADSNAGRCKSIFTAVAPISGYQYSWFDRNFHRQAFSQEGGGAGAGGAGECGLTWDPTKVTDGGKLDIFPGQQVPIFFHHSKSDQYVRITGCCSDPTKPSCCCDISSPPPNGQAPSSCSPLSSRFEQWSERNGFGGGAAAISLVQSFGQPEDTTTTDLTAAMQRPGGGSRARGVRCYTATAGAVANLSAAGAGGSAAGGGADSRVANTTMCVYEGGGHFNSPRYR